MASNQHINFLASTVMAEDECATFAGRPVLDCFHQLYWSLDKSAGPDVAALLAVPETGFSKLRNATIVSWYTAIPGQFRPLTVLDVTERATAESLLRARLQAALEHADPETFEKLTSALNVPDAEDILFNGEAAVITRWGFLTDKQPGGALIPLLPPDVVLVAHAGTGEPTTRPLVTLAAAAPAESSAPSTSTGETAPAVPVPAPTPISATNTSPPSAAAPSPAPPAEPASVRRLMPLLAFSVFLGLFLIYMLWGNLVYPLVSEPSGDGQSADALRSSNAAIAEDVNRLQTALGGDVCSANDGALDRIGGLPVLPSTIPSAGGQTPEGQAPSSEAPGTANPQPGAGLPGTATPPTDATPPAGTTPPAARPSSNSLLDRLDRGTVFVVGTAGDGVAMGSGFFVGPQHVLTNFHVVENVNSQLVVTNPHMQGIVPAEITARSPNSDIGKGDFALLRLQRPVDLPRLPISEIVERLDSVISAGYPSFVISTDPSFIAAFKDGDTSRLANLPLATTRGEITAKQLGPGGTSLIAHSATISPGNSGGPLVDACGRIVGVNTYTRTDAENSLRLNFALSAKDARAFLKQNGIDLPAEGALCQMPSVAATAPPATPAPPAVSEPAPSPASGNAAAPTQLQTPATSTPQPSSPPPAGNAQ